MRGESSVFYAIVAQELNLVVGADGSVSGNDVDEIDGIVAIFDVETQLIAGARHAVECFESRRAYFGRHTFEFIVVAPGHPLSHYIYGNSQCSRDMDGFGVGGHFHLVSSAHYCSAAVVGKSEYLQYIGQHTNGHEIGHA